MVKKVYIDSDGSRYEENKACLEKSMKNIREKGDIWWDLCIGLIADLNTSCTALNLPVITNPEEYLLSKIKSHS